MDFGRTSNAVEVCDAEDVGGTALGAGVRASAGLPVSVGSRHGDGNGDEAEEESGLHSD